jgi:hypothetical protein
MHRLKKLYGKLLLASLVLTTGLTSLPAAFAQGRQAVVVLRSTSATAASQCEGTAEIKYQLIFNPKLNNREEIRLLADSNVSPAQQITRQWYDDAKRVRLRDLHSFTRNGNGIFYAVMVPGQTPQPALSDDKRPERNVAFGFTDFYAVALSGEARDGKQRRPVMLPLSDVQRIYLTAEGAAANDALFNHALEEQSVAVWETYLRLTSNHRASEANAQMRQALIVCAEAELAHFLKGDYRAIERAREKAQRAHGAREDEASTQLLARIRKEKQQVDGARGQADTLIRASDWEKALAAIEPIKIYLDSWPELKQMFEHAIKQSHETNCFECEKALKAKQLELARKHGELAWQRLPSSARARECTCEARKLSALGKAETARQQRRPKEAKEVLENQLGDRDCGSDSRLSAELGKAKCEYAQQLLAQARQLITVAAPGAPPPSLTTPNQPSRPLPTGGRGTQGRRPPLPAPKPTPTTAPAPPPFNLKLLTAQNKNDFREARVKLLEAERLCGDGQIQTMLAATNRSLSGYCLAEARRAMQRGAAGTAYVYLQTAQGYTPNEAAVHEVLQQAQTQLDAQTRVGVGVAFVNRSGNSEAEMLLNELAAQLEATAQQAGLSNPVVLDRRQAAVTLQAIQTGRQLPTAAVIFFGDLLAANVRAANTPRRVQSYYLVDNPQYQQADQYYAAAKDVYEQCKRANGGSKLPCGAQEAEVNRRDNLRRQYPKQLKEPYVYYENVISVDGQLRLAFRALDSVARGTGAAETLGDSVAKQCVARNGVSENDANRTFLGPSVQNTTCDRVDAQTYLSQMLNTVGREARSRALGQLRQLPLSYYSRAQSAANRQQAMEDYLRFLFLTADKNSREAEEAKKALVAFDAELQTDGVLR